MEHLREPTRSSLPDYLFSRSFYEGNFFEKSFPSYLKRLGEWFIQHEKRISLKNTPIINCGCPLYWVCSQCPLGGANRKHKKVRRHSKLSWGETTGRTTLKIRRKLIGSPDLCINCIRKAKDHYRIINRYSDNFEKLDRYAWDQSISGRSHVDSDAKKRDKIMNETGRKQCLIYTQTLLGGYKHASGEKPF